MGTAYNPDSLEPHEDDSELTIFYTDGNRPAPSKNLRKVSN